MTPVRHRATNGPFLDVSSMNNFSPREASSSAPPSASFIQGTRPTLGNPFSWPDHQSAKEDDYYRDSRHWDSSHSFDSEDANLESPSARRPDSSATRARSNVGETGTPDRRNEARPKRTARAQQACENCRQKKSKCDEQSPQCKNCWEANIECKYKGTKPGKKDQSMTDLTGKIDGCRQQISDLTHMVHLAIQSIESGHRIGYDQLSYHMQAQQFLPNTQSGFASPLPASSMTVSFNQDNIDQPYIESNKVDEDILQGTLSIPFEHSTPAHKLVENWKCLKPFYRGIANHNYVMDIEGNRAPLAASVVSPAWDKKTFSTLLKTSFPPRFSFERENYPHHSHQDGTLRCEAMAINRTSGHDCSVLLGLESKEAQNLWGSFLRRIYILHPFVDTHRIGQLVKSFALCAATGGSPSQMNSILAPNELPERSLFKTADAATGEKRKRTDDYSGSIQHQKLSGEHAAKLNAQKAIETAIVLLVFALGEICETEKPTYGSRAYGIPSTAPCEPPSWSTSELTPAAPRLRFSTFKRAGFYVDECMQDDPSHRSQLSTSETPEDFVSIDSTVTGVPGLAYYIAASRILGELAGSTELTCVHAMLLAGLYASQLLRPKESYTWISSAGRAMIIILQANPHSWPDSIRIPYWTCLQLESDLLAELEFPPSGISRFEEQVPLPGYNTNGPKDPLDPAFDMHSIMAFFGHQVYLRKTLNRTHTALYNTEGNTGSNNGWSAMTAKGLSDILEAWKESLPKEKHDRLWWDESDPPAEEIMTARMRAKYYGAKVIINRPFLQRALRANEQFVRSQSSSFASDAAAMDLSDGYPAGVPIVDEETLVGARSCVAALIKSTEAFDGQKTMPRRLIVTNLFGTASAQFANILALAAVVRSGYLTSLITITDFDRLLRRTIDLIGNLAPMSETFQGHLKVLHTIQEDLIISR